MELENFMPNKDVCRYETLVSHQTGKIFVRTDRGMSAVPLGQPARAQAAAGEDILKRVPGLNVSSNHG
jgi:hypothetical protein